MNPAPALICVFVPLALVLFSTLSPSLSFSLAPPRYLRLPGQIMYYYCCWHAAVRQSGCASMQMTPRTLGRISGYVGRRCTPVRPVDDVSRVRVRCAQLMGNETICVRACAQNAGTEQHFRHGPKDS